MGVNHQFAIVDRSEWGDVGLYLFLALFFGSAILASRIWPASFADSREPDLVRPKIPIIGHALGMLMHQAEYLSTLCNANNLPIFTIKIFGAQLYLVNSPELTQAVFRHSKTFSFEPISAAASERLFQMTDRQMKILAKPISGNTGFEIPLHALTTRVMHNIMAPGPNAPMLLMNHRALHRFAQFINPIGKEGISVNMLAWLTEAFTVSTSVGVYGPESPVETDRSLIPKLHDFENSVGLLMMNVAPSIIASKGHAGREAFKAAFQKYYRKGGHKKTSGIITARYDALIEGGFATDDIATFDLGIMLAASMNSNPAIFWLISYIFSDPELLAEIREEVSSAVTVSNKKATIDIPQLLNSCPLLTSCMQEMLRLTDDAISTRIITEDALLNGTYLLRKGGIVQIVCGPMHHSSSIWGSDSHLFNARRFIKTTQDNLSKETRKSQNNGFTPFGGGATLCPGRHFATMEILGVAATMVVGYEITMKDGSLLKMPKPKKQAFAVVVKHVDGDVGVKIKRREGWEELEWAYDVGLGRVEGSDELA